MVELFAVSSRIIAIVNVSRAFLFTVFLSLVNSRGQGFVNLDFEQSVPTNIFDFPNGLQVGDAIVPGWAAFVNGSPSSFLYNTIVSPEGSVTLAGGSFVPSLQGNYFIELDASDVIPQSTAGIGQTGTIPSWAQSLTFIGNVQVHDLSFNGQLLTITQTGTTANYNIYAANVSAYAGQNGLLLYTAGFFTIDRIDNIQFSSTPAPEPSELALAAIGMSFALLRYRFWGEAASTVQ